MMYCDPKSCTRLRTWSHNFSSTFSKKKIYPKFPNFMLVSQMILFIPAPFTQFKDLGVRPATMVFKHCL